MSRKIMKLIWSASFLILYIGTFHPAHSLPFPSVGDGQGIRMTADMLPMLTSFIPINSTAIRYTWHPSPSVIGANLDQLQGVFTDGFYAGTRMYLMSSILAYNMDKLIESGQEIVNGLSADTVYYACYESKWFQPNTPMITFNFDGVYRRQCSLVRTYMPDQTTLNPVPQFGEYTWKQQTTKYGTLSIVINARISSKLPYDIRTITVRLGTHLQSQTFTTPSESVEFQFLGLDSKIESYPLVFNFTLTDSITPDVFTVSNIVNGTITTTASSMGNRLFAWQFIFLILSTMLISF